MRHGLDAVLAMREGRLKRDEIDHLRQCQGRHREIYALPSDRQQADGRAEHCRRSDARDKRNLWRQAQAFSDIGADIAARPQKHGVAKGQQTDVANQQIEGAGKQRKTERLHDEIGVHEQGQDAQRRNHQGKGNGFTPRRRACDRWGPINPARFHQVAFPNRPAGLRKRTMAMMTKITMFEASG